MKYTYWYDEENETHNYLPVYEHKLDTTPKEWLNKNESDLAKELREKSFKDQNVKLEALFINQVNDLMINNLKPNKTNRLKE